jgi:hypothetical protein
MAHRLWAKPWQNLHKPLVKLVWQHLMQANH